MQYRPLGQTNIQVSQLCLGTMTWGQQNTEQEAHQQLDMAVDAGINFIDTAELYPVPPRPETQGLTETYLGSWLARPGNRHKVIVATKVVGRSRKLVQAAHIRQGNTCLDRQHIQMAVETSLQRLRTDTIDLYQLHWPDRPTNHFGELGYRHQAAQEFIAIEETLRVLSDLIKSGKIRMIGVSNETPWGVHEFLRQAELQGLPRIVSIQNPYNLLNRSFEIGLAEMAIREQTGLLAYSPLAFGALTGKYLQGQTPSGCRLTLWERFARYKGPVAEKAIQAYVTLAREHGIEPAHLALAWVNSRDFVTSTILGATRPEQLQMNIASLDIPLPDALLQGIERIHAEFTNPCP